VTGNDNDQKEPSITVCSGAQSQHPARFYDDPCNAYHEVHGDKRGKQNPSACLKFFNTLEFLLPVYCIDVSQRQDVTPNYAALQKNPLRKSIEEA